jgi:hypothetical protein
MLSIISHPHTTLLLALWTSARIPRFAAHGLNLTSGTAYSVHSSCGLHAVRLSSLAYRTPFFPSHPTSGYMHRVSGHPGELLLSS